MMSPKLVGRTALQRAPHALRFELEHAHRVAALEQGVDLGIVPRQRVEIDVDPAIGEQLGRLLEHRQRLEPEEVELHQAGIFDIFHVELGDRHVGPRIAVERHQLRERPIADHHARGVGRRVARQPFQLHRQVEQVADVAWFLYSAASSLTRRSARGRASTDRSGGSGSAWRAGRSGHSSSAARGRCPSAPRAPSSSRR